MQVNSFNQTQFPTTASKAPSNLPAENESSFPSDSFSFQCDHDCMETAAIAGVAGAAFLGLPAAIGATLGAAGVGAVALGTAAVYEISNSMANEIKVEASEILYAATLMAGITSIGAIGGAAAAVTAAAAGAGFAIYKAFEDR